MIPSSRTLWWLNPATIFTLACVGIAVPAYLLPSRVYEQYWRTSKHFDGHAFLLTLACAAVFSAGSLIGDSRTGCGIASGNPGGKPWADMMPWTSVRRLFQASFYLTLFGYAVWTAAAISRGARLDLLVDVISGSKGALYIFQHDYLSTVGGLTTLTECGIPAMIFGSLLGNRIGYRFVWRKLAVIFLLALVRAFLNSERFAIIELAVPFLVLLVNVRYLAPGASKTVSRNVLRLAPVLGMAALPFVFTMFEYFRSWNNFYATSGDYSLAEFGASRLLGYYVTSFNNGAFLLTKARIVLSAPYFTLHFFWTFPIVSGLARSVFPHLAFDSDASFLSMLQSSGVNPEFNSADGVLNPLIDFGSGGGLLYWFAIGIVCGLLYGLYKRQRPAGLCFYPFIFLGVVETPLALYWSEGKAIPPYILLMASTLILTVYARRPGRWLSAGALRESGSI
jgi:hypothetical protein